MKRADGVRVTNETPMYYLLPHILPKRYDSMNMCTVDIPLSPMQEYRNKKRKEGIQISHLALVLCAYMRAVEKFPALNRFIANKRIYQRNEVCAAMVVLRPGHKKDDTFAKIYFDPKNDTIFDVEKKVDDYINSTRDVNNTNSLDKIMALIMKFDFLVSGICNILRFADKHGLLPKAIIDASPFHATLLITNLASIRTNHIYHHVYEFGTTSVAIAMGNPREVPRTVRGEVKLERCIPLGLVMDERICSGHYFAEVFAFVKDLLKHPEKMEVPLQD